MKKVTITVFVNDDTNQNAFKDWVKTCPFSKEGNQTILWENLEADAPAPKIHAAQAARSTGEADAKAEGEGNGQAGDSGQSGETENSGETIPSGEILTSAEAPQDGEAVDPNNSGIAPVEARKDNERDENAKFAA